MIQTSIFITHCILWWIAFPGRTKITGGPHAAHGPRVEDPCWKLYFGIQGMKLELVFCILEMVTWSCNIKMSGIQCVELLKCVLIVKFYPNFKVFIAERYTLEYREWNLNRYCVVAMATRSCNLNPLLPDGTYKYQKT